MHFGLTRLGGVLLVACATCIPASAKSKPMAATEYFGHLQSWTGTKFVIHIDAFTPDEAAAAVATAGHDGDANAIRKALGRLDAGFVKLGTRGYRVAFARRYISDEGSRIVLIIRNELDLAPSVNSINWGTPPFNPPGRTNGKQFVIPPLAAVDVRISKAGSGSAVVATTATVTFHSLDHVVITDWGLGWLICRDLQEQKHVAPSELLAGPDGAIENPVPNVSPCP